MRPICRFDLNNLLGLSALFTTSLLGGCAPELLQGGNNATLGASRSVVGMAIYAPDNDLGSPIAEGQGKPVFADLDGDGCVVQDPLAGDSNGQVHTWTKTAAYYGYLESDTKLDGSLTNAAVLSTTLSAASRRSIDRASTIAGSVYEFNAYKQLFSLAVDCQDARQGKGRLDNDLWSAFNALPYPVSDASQTRVWDPYQRFLKTYGSHYVTQVKSGARYRNYTFKKTFKEVKESELTIAACVSAEGVPTEAGKLSIKGCQDIDKKQAESISLTDYTSNTTAFGGQQAIRDRLAAGEAVTPELLTRFADTADHSQDGVQYWLKPIWELLARRAQNDKQSNQARTLEAYFEGFIASNCNQVHGCGCSLVKDSKGNVTLRRFTQTDKDYAQYRCERPAIGCRKDEDCHYNYTGQYCRCYGDHCINRGKGGSSVVNYSTRIDGKNKGPNKSCTYKIGSCKCQRPAKGQFWEPLWTSGG